MNYKDRKIFDEIFSFIFSDDIIVIHGARQVGKTTLLKIIIHALKNKENINSSNLHYFDLEDVSYLALCNSGVDNLLKYISVPKNTQNRFFIFIDEIQYLDNPTNFLKIFHDHHPECKLIVSGSSSFDIKKKFKDSLVGRTVDFELFTLDFDEFLTFKNENINLSDLNYLSLDIVREKLNNLFSEFLIYGGYPKIVLESSVKKKETYLKQIINTYIKKDIKDLANIKNISRFNNLLKILSSQTGNLLNVTELSNTIGISRQTVDDYLFILENTYVIKKINPFFQNIRTELTKMPKLFFEDTGLLNILRYGTFVDNIDGQLLENGIFSILRRNINSEFINFWRTKQKTEIDFVINLNTKIFPIEVKLSYPRKAIKTINYFLKEYNIKKGAVVSLRNNKQILETENIKPLFPWELYSLLNTLKDKKTNL